MYPHTRTKVGNCEDNSSCLFFVLFYLIYFHKPICMIALRYQLTGRNFFKLFLFWIKCWYSLLIISAFLYQHKSKENSENSIAHQVFDKLFSFVLLIIALEITLLVTYFKWFITCYLIKFLLTQMITFIPFSILYLYIRVPITKVR